MRKGVVMESNGKWTVVLTPEGEFMRIPSHPHHFEGKEVTFRISAAEDVPKKKKIWTPLWMRGVALTAACLLVLVMTFPMFGGSQAYAAVTIDINPSMELEVDEHAKVIQAFPFNEEAQKLLAAVEWKDQDLSEVALDIIEQAELMGYMNEERQVLITATYLDEEEEEVKEQEKEDITLILEEATSQADQELTVVIVEGNKEWHEEAKEKQVPPGAYMLIKQAEEQGVDLKEKEWQANPIEELPPVNGITIIHPKGNQKDKAAEKAKKEQKQENKEKKQDIKEEKKQSQKSDDKAREVIKEINKENKKEDKKEKAKDTDKEDWDKEERNKDREDKGREINKSSNKDDKKQTEEKENKTERPGQNQKEQENENEKEKGSSGPSSYGKKNSSSDNKKDNDQKKQDKKENEDRDSHDNGNKREKD